MPFIPSTTRGLQCTEVEEFCLARCAAHAAEFLWDMLARFCSVRCWILTSIRERILNLNYSRPRQFSIFVFSSFNFRQDLYRVKQQYFWRQDRATSVAVEIIGRTQHWCEYYPPKIPQNISFYYDMFFSDFHETEHYTSPSVINSLLRQHMKTE